ncbi:MAG: hypothetical protein DMG00_03795 [Acidobacteria bacterium]|nr:MAG: hypothetical protein DMG00_03795 [Acidobacteriota bacterium]
MKTWLTVAEGAEYAGVSRDMIYTACERRELAHARLAGRRAIRLRREWIDGWIEQHTRGVHTPHSDSDTQTQAVEARGYANGRIERTGSRNATDGMKVAIGRSANLPEHEYRDGC